MAKPRPPEEGPYPAIGEYALISDCHSAALISRAGSIDWCLLDRFDGRPVFARLLDWERGGHFQIAPERACEVEREYCGESNVLRTRFHTERGVLELTDFMPVDGGDSEDEGSAEPVAHHQVLRHVRCTDGRICVLVDFAPRFDYGTTVPRIERHSDGAVVVYGGADALLFQCDMGIEPADEGSCHATAELAAGDEIRIALTRYAAHRLQDAKPLSASDFEERLRSTIRFWSRWTRRCTYEGPHRDAVIRSALVLKGLTYAPTGAIVAAPTTSLPESIGGVRNWDYRFTWLRDATMILDSFLALGYPDEAERFGGYIWRTTAGRPEDLQIMYGIEGERLLSEVELDPLEGYRHSRPVRIGNAASEQFQLDVPGDMLNVAERYATLSERIDENRWGFLRGVVAYVAERWREPDHGLWEIRGEPRLLTHSKIMCWVAVDRAIRIARALDLEAPLDDWMRLARKIRSVVDQNGHDPGTSSFVRELGGSVPDASLLQASLLGFCDPGDERVRATAARVREELSVDDLVYRYRCDDGLPGEEGAFLLCSFWLVDVLSQLGHSDEALELFDRLVDVGNDVGLLAEEVDPSSGSMLGNFPQGFSHLGLINSAIRLAEVEE